MPSVFVDVEPWVFRKSQTFLHNRTGDPFRSSKVPGALQFSPVGVQMYMDTRTKTEIRRLIRIRKVWPSQMTSVLRSHKMRIITILREYVYGRVLLESLRMTECQASAAGSE